MEVWKDVVGFERAYRVSNLGRIKSTINKIILDRWLGGEE